MAFLSRKKYSKNGTYTGQRMYAEAGFRERDIMNNAKFVVGSKRNNTVSFYKKHKKEGRFDHTKYDIATYRFGGGYNSNKSHWC